MERGEHDAHGRGRLAVAKLLAWLVAAWLAAWLAGWPDVPVAVKASQRGQRQGDAGVRCRGGRKHVSGRSVPTNRWDAKQRSAGQALTSKL